MLERWLLVVNVFERYCASTREMTEMYPESKRQIATINFRDGVFSKEPKHVEACNKNTEQGHLALKIETSNKV